MRPSTRSAVRHFHKGIRFRDEAQEWSDDEKRQWILARLRIVVRRANQDTTYYRELFQRIGFDPRADFGFEDYAQLPALEREDVQQAGPTLVSMAVPPQQLRKDATGGSSGKPVEIWMGPEERGWRESGIEWFMRRIGVPPGSRKALLWGHHLDPVASDRLPDRIRDFVNNVRWYESLRLSPGKLVDYHRALTRRPPVCVVAYAKALSDLAGVVRDLDVQPDYPTRCMVTGAEKLMAEQRELIERTFGRPVHERYGSRDLGVIAFQLHGEASGAFQVDWSNLMVEPETSERASSLLITKLHGDGMPMLRYRVGDVARFPASDRPGFPSFVLREIQGRITDRLWLPDGSWVDGSEFPHMMKDHPVLDFQAVQRQDMSVEVSVIPAAGFSDESRHTILTTLMTNLRGVEIHLKEVEQIPRSASNKWRPVRTEVLRPTQR
jgi:phenylacetate-CoA ligase